MDAYERHLARNYSARALSALVAADDAIINDERAGLPSASGMERLCLCPGSWRAAKLCPKGEDTDDAKMGTRLHSHMENGTLPEDEDEAAACKWCSETEHRLAAELFAESADASSFAEGSIIRERRLWNAERTFSGQADVIFHDGKRALVFDYKFGRNAVTEAPRNLQLAALAILVADNFPGVEEVHAGILQPYFSKGEPPLVYFDRPAIEDARRYFAAAIRIASGENPPLYAGMKQCRYCPAASSCPATQLAVRQTSLASFERWGDLTPDQKREWYFRAKTCEKAIKRIMANVRKDIEEGNAIPGLCIARGKKAFTVTDASKAFSVLNAEVGLEADAFAACCTIKISSLDEAVHAKLKETNPRQTKQASRDALRDILRAWQCGEEKTSAGSIEERRGA